jgi:hypothetical protein
MSRVEDTLDRIEARLDALDRQAERNNALLEEHIRRTNILEQTVVPLEKEWSKAKTIMYVLIALLGGTGLLGTFGKNLYGLVTGVP